MNALTVFEQQLQPLAPRFAEVLPANVPPERLMRTIVVSVERLPKLLDCDRQSLFNAAMSAAILGLEVDGVTGQAYLIPFKNRAQLVVGYKGYNTLAARSGITITGKIVREGDAFDYDVAEGWVTHKPLLNNKGRITGAWAKAAANGRPPVVEVMGIDDLMAVKAKSPGSRMSDSPWNDTTIGFPAMCEKTVKRRLARSLPLNVMQYAARLDEAVDEQGKPAWIDPDRGVIIDGKAEPSETPSAQDLIGSRPRAETGPVPAQSDPLQEAGTGEVTSDDVETSDALLAAAAELGVDELQTEWKKLRASIQKVLKVALDRRHKPRAVEVDAAKA